MNGFHKWPFLSVQMWGEDPRGTWVLMVESVTTNPSLAGKLQLFIAFVVFYTIVFNAFFVLFCGAVI